MCIWPWPCWRRSPTGTPRQEILAALGSDDLEDLRTQAKAVWRSVYRQDGAVNSVLANSLWLDQGESFRQETVDLLAENDYASVYRGEMGSEELDKASAGLAGQNRAEDF